MNINVGILNEDSFTSLINNKNYNHNANLKSLSSVTLWKKTRTNINIMCLMRKHIDIL